MAKLDSRGDRGGGSAKVRGSSINWSPILRAEAASLTMVQSITSFCEVTPDHSTKQIAMRPCGPERIASITRGFESAGRIAFTLKLELARVDAGAKHRRRARAAESTGSSARSGVASARSEAANTSRRRTVSCRISMRRKRVPQPAAKVTIRGSLHDFRRFAACACE